MKLVEDYSSWSGTGMETYLPEVSLSQRPDLIDELPQFKMYQDGSQIIITDDDEGILHYQTLDLATGATAFQRYDFALERELKHKQIVGNSSYRDGKIYRLTGSYAQAKLSIIDLSAQEIVAENSIFRNSYPDVVSPPYQAMLELYRGEQTKRKAKEIDIDDFFEELHRAEPSITVNQTSDSTVTCTLAAIRTIGYTVGGMTRQPFTMRIGGVFSPNYIFNPWSPMQTDDMRISYVKLALSGDSLVPLSGMQHQTVPQLVAAHERKWHRRTPQSAKTVLCLSNGDVVYGYYSGRKQYTLETVDLEK